jgi:hypothetical protein
MIDVLKRVGVACLFASATAVAVQAQWSNYPTPGVPRLPNGKVDLTAKAPRTADGHPDLSGVWLNADIKPEGGITVPVEKVLGLNLARDLPSGEAPLQPWAKALAQQHEKDHSAADPLNRCLPGGIPRWETGPPFKIVTTPGVTIMLLEGPYPMSTFRQIFTDGRALPRDPQPTWLGYSVGHWDGDELVVDTTGFNDRGWLDTNKGLPQSEALHVIERFRRRDVGHLEVQITIDDPKVFTTLWSAKMMANLLPDAELIEAVCENEKDAAHINRGESK